MVFRVRGYFRGGWWEAGKFWLLGRWDRWCCGAIGWSTLVKAGWVFRNVGIMMIPLGLGDHGGGKFGKHRDKGND